MRTPSGDSALFSVLNISCCSITDYSRTELSRSCGTGRMLYETFDDAEVGTIGTALMGGYTMYSWQLRVLDAQMQIGELNLDRIDAYC